MAEDSDSDADDRSGGLASRPLSVFDQFATHDATRTEIANLKRRVLILEEESHERGRRVIQLARQLAEARNKQREAEEAWSVLNRHVLALKHHRTSTSD